MTLSIGDTAPDFTLAGDGGEISLAVLKGKVVVLYFYPKDDTPGCTTEAKAFSVLADDFAAADAVVIGISKDTIVRHAKFRAKYALTPLLGADTEGKVIEAYGVWVEKSLYGRQYMGIERATFLIDTGGKIANIWHKVKVKGHAEEVLAAVQTLA